MSKKKVLLIITGIMLFVIIGVVIIIHCVSSATNVKKTDSRHLKEELADYQFSSHENLIFDCKVQNTDIGEVYKYKLHDHTVDKAGEDEKQKAYALWRSLVPDESIQPDYSQDSPYSWYVRTEKPFAYGAFYCGGTFGASSWFWETDAEINDSTVYKRFRGCDDMSSESYCVGGEEYKITDAMKFCDDYIDKNLKQYFNKDEQFKLINVFVIENEMFDKYTYALRYAHLIDGVAIDDCDSSDLEREYTRGSYLEIIMAGKNKIYSIENRCYQGIFDEKEKLDELVPLSEAERILSKELAPNKKYTVTECELKYVCRTTANAKERYYKPMWSFTLEQYPNRSLDLKINLTAYVDAMSGEVFMFDMQTGQLSELSTN